MIDKHILDKLDETEKEEFKKNLESIIERTFDLEKEYKDLNASVIGLQKVIVEVVESQPNPIWIIEQSPKQKIFYQNSASKNIAALFDEINLDQGEQEIEYTQKIFVVKINQVDTKTIISATDITAQKRSERLASMGQIAAHLAHEIRNPIGSISLLSSTLLKRVGIKEQPIVKEIQSAIYRVERIIKSTLLFTRGVKITREEILLSKLAQEIWGIFESYAYTKEVTLVVDFPDKSIFADLDLLSIVMQNFLYNAIDAIEESEREEGIVVFSYEKEAEYDCIIVKDDGNPIQDKNILYEPFKTTKTKGHGLGLALSLEIIKAHDGKIELLEIEKGFKIYIKDKDI